MAEPESPAHRARVSVGGGDVAVETGIPVLDHLVGLMARYARIGVELEVEPGTASEEATVAGTALGDALRPFLYGVGARGHGSASVPSGEALAHVAVDVSGHSLFASNVDLSAARAGGLAADVIGEFLRSLALGAGFTVHVRLLEGDDPEHVLEAIFKALGASIAGACAS
jgi:imidazoleglycerol-phosphate dehydratase